MARSPRLLEPDQRRSVQRLTSGVHVLASRLPRLALEARRVSAFVNGVHGRRRPGPGETFWQYRMLTTGEAASGIDWRRSGRDNRVYVREREWEASHTIWLWIDRSASMGFASALAKTPKVDRALVLGLGLADALVDAGERVGFMGLTRPLASRNIVEKLIEHIALDKAGVEQDLPPLAPLARADEAILISDWLTPAPRIDATFRALGANGVRGHVVMIVDPIEETFPFSGQAELHDVESDLKLDVGDAAAWGRDYRVRIAAHRDAIAATCRTLGWSFTLHHTDASTSQAALKIGGFITASRTGRAA
jgi:uncharacterized protein (DUF58 family)